MMNKLLILFLSCFISFTSHAQQGGSNIFDFLNVAPSGYSHSLGGIMISNASNDISTALQNPATLSEETRNALSFNYNFNTAGIGTGYVAYGDYLKKYNLDWHAAIQYADYGDFIGADEWGNRTTDFNAADYALVLGATRHLNEKFHIGVNTKFIYSRLESYIATGIGFDIGAYYDMPERKSSIGIVAKNLGFVTKAYVNEGGLLPFDFQVGFNKQLKHLPFRYIITAHHLYKWDVRYDDPSVVSENLLGESDEASQFAQFSDNLFRHLIFGGEFLLGKKENLKIRFAYNHMLRRELVVTNLRGFAGFSGGLQFKIKGFFVGYSFGMQHLHGSTKQLSLSTNLNNFRKKKKK